MPLYEYRCDACEHQFEVIQSFSAKPIRKCEKCGGKVRKLISRAGFVLKGGGWYDSGYGSSKETPASSKESSSEGSDASSADKPGAKPADKPGAEPAKKAAEKSEPAAATAAPAAGKKSSRK